MLIQVLNEIENSNGPIRLIELSKKVDIEPAVLEGMLEHWARKGRIQRTEDYLAVCKTKTCGQGCHTCTLP